MDSLVSLIILLVLPLVKDQLMFLVVIVRVLSLFILVILTLLLLMDTMKQDVLMMARGSLSFLTVLVSNIIVIGFLKGSNWLLK